MMRRGLELVPTNRPQKWLLLEEEKLARPTPK
jgi:hypothetical protein